MEQHQIPRNITSFQFKLIGNMTLRQFFFALGGGLIGFVIYKATGSLHPYLGIGFGAISLLVGLAFAFMPIQERPLDQWLFLFIRSIFSPTQYIWLKEGRDFHMLLIPVRSSASLLNEDHKRAHLEARMKLDKYLKTLPRDMGERENLNEEKYIKSTLDLFTTMPNFHILENRAAQRDTTNSELFPPAPEKIKTDTAPGLKDNQTFELINLNTEAKAPTVKTASPDPSISAHTTQTQSSLETVSKTSSENIKVDSHELESKTLGVIENKEQLEKIRLSEELKKAAVEREELIKQLNAIKSEVETLRKQPMQEDRIVTPQIDTEVKKAEPTVKIIQEQNASDKLGMPSIPHAPNIISGVVKDPQRHMLPNIILTIKDSKNLPLRALKTNKLGQFASATPLPNGIYYIYTEDPMKRYNFDTAQVSLTGKMFLPIEITAKGDREILREQLARQIFTQNINQSQPRQQV